MSCLMSPLSPLRHLALVTPSLSHRCLDSDNIPVIYYRTLFLRGPIPFSIPANTSPSKIYDHLGEFGRRRQKICLGQLQWAPGSRQPSACQIPFDAELMARPVQTAASAHLSLSLRARHSDGGLLLLRHSDWMSPWPQLHIISRSNQQFKCQF